MCNFLQQKKGKTIEKKNFKNKKEEKRKKGVMGCQLTTHIFVQ
jgi:hypothetical protein